MKRWLFIFLLLTACGPGQTPSRPTSVASTPTYPPSRGIIPQDTSLPIIETATTVPKPSQTPRVIASDIRFQSTTTEFPATPRPTSGPQDWQTLPVIPSISKRVIEIYQKGLAAGNNLHAFSKVGDCESTPTWFLGDYDLSPEHYRLGPYQSLESVISYFKDSFSRTSLAARRGFKASSALTPLWADRTQCNKNETPLACEYRLHRPILAFIMLGTNDVYHQDTFESQLRQIIEYTIAQGIIPVLATKADNLEGDGSINATITKLAWEYDIPLWNFWLAVQSLPNQGLQPDGSHLTWAQNLFDDPNALKNAWPMRNLTALQVLDAIWQVITDQTIP